MSYVIEITDQAGTELRGIYSCSPHRLQDAQHISLAALCILEAVHTLKHKITSFYVDRKCR